MEVALFVSICRQSERSERVQNTQVVARAKRAQLLVVYYPLNCFFAVTVACEYFRLKHSLTAIIALHILHTEQHTKNLDLDIGQLDATSTRLHFTEVKSAILVG